MVSIARLEAVDEGRDLRDGRLGHRVAGSQKRRAEDVVDARGQCRDLTLVIEVERTLDGGRWHEGAALCRQQRRADGLTEPFGQNRGRFERGMAVVEKRVVAEQAVWRQAGNEPFLV